MKRSYRLAEEGEGEGELETIDSMALALMLLSRAGGLGEDTDSSMSSSSGSAAGSSVGRVFECKTCSRRFPSFQALGGHRASHKKAKLLVDGGEAVGKPRVHECSVCGLEFAIGQALGGHMRRHRGAAGQGKAAATEGDEEKKRSSSSSSSSVPWLDLNVAPAEAGGGCGAVVSCRKKIFGFELAVDTSAVAVDCFH